MKAIYAKRIVDGAIVEDITGHNILPDGCERYFSDSTIVLHASGSPSVKIVDGAEVPMTADDIKLESLYVVWWNRNVETQLAALDIKRIRPCAEISDDNCTADEKKAAKDVLKALNEQAKILRRQLL